MLHAAAGDVGGVQFPNYVYAVLMAQYLPMSNAAVALVSGSAGAAVAEERLVRRGVLASLP